MTPRDSSDTAIAELIALATRTEQAERELADLKARLLPFYVRLDALEEIAGVESYVAFERGLAGYKIGDAMSSHPRAMRIEPDDPSLVAPGYSSRVYRITVLLEPEQEPRRG